MVKFELKTLSPEGVPGALAKAERYRLLNEPWQAESICRDVLQADPDNQQALVLLILALSDQFGSASGAGFEEARTQVAKLRTEYERAYYSGIVCERRARTHFERGHPGSGGMAFEWYVQAMDWFERAEKERPPGNEDAKLRWNTCARMLMTNPSIKPAPTEPREQMLE